jgi:hypothetical protein
MSEEHISDQIPAFVLGSLDFPEKIQVEMHLQKCEDCRHELETYQNVMDGIVLAIPQFDPPRPLKKNILEAVRSEQAQNPSYSVHIEMPVRRRWFTRLKPLLLIWSIISLILMLALTSISLVLAQQVRDLSQNKVMVYSEYRIIPLSGTSNAPGASGIMVITNHGYAASVNVDGLPPLDPGHQYQLWLIQQGSRINGGVFSVSPSGVGTLKVNSSLSFIDFTSIGITIEPAGGSPGPTGNKVLGGGL